MLANTHRSYGAVTKTFHWTIAIGILAMIPLGIVANGTAHAIEAGDASLIDRARLLFSIHKTLGVTILFAALARILWAITQPKPAPLHPERRAETFLASLVHWLLYGSLVAVPLTGWAAHAATTGFAPIWWPFGQNLPPVPESAEAEHLFAALHIVFERVLVLAILLHVAGALKHHFWDRDDTLRRMLPGRVEAGAGDHPRPWAPAGAALGVWAVALGIGGALGLYRDVPVAEAATLDAVASAWTVEEGTIGISVQQLGSEVTGSFDEWTARIDFSEEAGPDGTHGEVEVTIAIPSLSLGTVSGQAMGPDFFDAETFATARVTGDIVGAEEGYALEGEITIRGASVPLSMPFEIAVEGDTATATGETVLDRRDFGIGGGYPDESSLGFAVPVRASLTATRTE